MKNIHTLGLLSHGCDDDPASGDIYAEDGSLIAAVFVNGEIESRESNARRLVACWNVCVGIPVKNLEKASGGTVPVLELLLEKFTQCDEFLDLLREVSMQPVRGGALPSNLLSRIDAALAKESGETRRVKLTKKSPPIAAQYLNGESPRERGYKKQKKVIQWIYRWGFSSAEIIRQVSGQQAKGYAGHLVKKGFLVETKTESGMPKFFYTLSQSGLEFAERYTNELYRYFEIRPSRVNKKSFYKDLLLQQKTISALLSGEISDYTTARMLRCDG